MNQSSVVLAQYVLSVTPPTSDCQSGSEVCVFMTDQTQYNLTLTASQTYNLTVRANDSCGNMGQPAKYDIDLTGTNTPVTWSVHTVLCVEACTRTFIYKQYFSLYMYIYTLLQLRQECKGTAATVTCMTPPLQK